MYDVEVADEVGTNAASIFNHISYWIQKHTIDGDNFHEGKYWVYASIKTLGAVYRFLSVDQIRTAMKKLIDRGFLEVGHFSKDKMNRTTWYALTEKGEIYAKIPKTHLGEIPEHLREIPQNSFGENPKTLKNNNKNRTIKERTIEEEIVSSSKDSLTKEKSEATPYKTIVEKFNSVCTSLPQCTKLSDKRRKAMAVCWREFGERIYEAFEKAEASDFLTGRDCKWNGCTFDWLFNSNNMLKVLEGNYDNKDRPGSDNSPKTFNELYEETVKRNEAYNEEDYYVDFD